MEINIIHINLYLQKMASIDVHPTFWPTSSFTVIILVSPSNTDT